jgi:ABC-type transport system involved in multi-copper enzyme maturation permease subunit
MIPLLRTELLKVRSTRTGVAGVLAAPAIAVFVTVAVLGAAGKNGNDPLQSATLVQVVGAPAGVITVAALLLGVLSVTGEYRHQTITTTFLATPRRDAVVAAKLFAALVVGAAMGVASVALSVAIAGPWLTTHHVGLQLGASVVSVAAGVVASTALFGALGVAVGALVRNQTAAMVGVLVWLLAVEGIVRDVFSRSELVRWLPAAAGRALVQPLDQRGALSGAAAAAVFVGYVVALAAAGVGVTRRRDIT